MEVTRLTPDGLVKRLVGETIDFTLQLNPDYRYETELYTNLNKETSTHHFIPCEDHYKLRLRILKSGYYTAYVRFRKMGSKRWSWLKDANGRKLTVSIQADPAWVAHAVVYNVFVRFFQGKTSDEPIVRVPQSSEITPQTQDDLMLKKVGKAATILPGDGGTFDDVKAHLQTLRKMHTNVLYLNPIHLIGEIYRGYNLMDQLPAYLQPGSPYSIKDYKSIDPELTYDKDSKNHLLTDPQQEFKDLINAAHDMGMFVIMDLVFNHTAHDFVLQRIKPEWYLYKEHINSLSDPYLYPEDVTLGKPWGDPHHSLAPYDHGIWWEDCAQLNWEYMLSEGPNDPPPNYSLKDMWEYFKSVPKYWIRNFGVDGFRCDVAYRVPSLFWKACIAEAREEAHQTKTNLSHDVVFLAESYTSHLKELQEAGFTAVYGDFSHKMGKPLNLKGYLDYIYNKNERSFPEGSRWLHFPDSHDFDRSPRKVLGDDLSDPHKAYLANQSRWLLTATLPGIPLIFNGFEKVEWQPINIWSYGAVNWDKEADLKEFISKVNDIRRRLPSLAKGSYTLLDTNQGLTEETQLMAYLREYGSDTVVVIVNMDVNAQAGPAVIYLPDRFNKKYTLLDLLTNKSYKREGRELTVVLPPGEGHIFSVIFH